MYQYCYHIRKLLPDYHIGTLAAECLPITYSLQLAIANVFGGDVWRIWMNPKIEYTTSPSTTSQHNFKSTTSSLLVVVRVWSNDTKDVSEIEKLKSTMVQMVNEEIEEFPNLTDSKISLLSASLITREFREVTCSKDCDCPPLMQCFSYPAFKVCKPQNMTNLNNVERNNLSDRRIIPGDNSTILKIPHSQPWAVGLLGEICYKEIPHAYELRVYCGGTLISSQHAITAYHCLGNGIAEVVVGEHDQSINDGQSYVNVKNIIPIKDRSFMEKCKVFNEKCVSEGKYDLAILVLEIKVSNKFASPAKLPRPYEKFEKYIVSGWGTMGRGDYSDVLRTVTLDAIEPGHENYYSCIQLIAPGTYGDDLLCGEDIKDIERGTCGGDSGGPWVVESDRGVILAGTHIWGICSDPHKSHTSVKLSNPETLRWIRETIAMEYESPCTISDLRIDIKETMREKYMNCSTICSISTDVCENCLGKDLKIRAMSSSCKNCLVEMNACFMLNCLVECIATDFDPYECERCAEKSGCSISKCYGSNYIPN